MCFCEWLWDFLGANFEAIIAFCALSLTVCQLAISRRHNRISVRPFLVANSSTVESDGKFFYEYSICNAGIGPACIKSFEVKHNNRILNNKPTVLEQQLESIISFKLSHISTFNIDYVLEPKREKLLLRFDVSSLNDKNIIKDIMEKSLDSLHLVIEYESFYGDQFTFDTRE